MARFIFSMQNILNMKEKLEEQAKNNFAQANRSLQEALLMQKQCENRLEAGKQTLKEAMLENLKVGQIRRREDDVEIFRMYLRQQILVVKQKEKEVEVAREHLNEAMKERKTFEKLKEKAFEKFKEFITRWQKSYPVLKRYCHDRYRLYFTYFKYEREIRGMIYTTNWIERLNRDYKRVINMRGAMPNSQAVILLMGTVARNADIYKYPIYNFLESRLVY